MVDPRTLSMEQQVALLSPEEQEAVLAGLDIEALLWDWRWGARPQQYLDPADESWSVALNLGGRGSGKAVCYDTRMPIPLTESISGPTGWTTMGEIKVGDKVFDERGVPCSVTAVFDVNPERAYRIHFSDGTSVDACSDHQWVTLDIKDRKKLSIGRTRGSVESPIPDDWAAKPSITTQQLVDTLYYGKRNDRNHCIPLTKPLDLPARGLPVDPWLLGYWLGNGSVKDGTVTAGLADADEIFEHVVALGRRVSDNYVKDPDRTAETRNVYGLVGDLRAVGVVQNKHIPAQYLRASVEQRMELLAGLLDSDGYIDPKKQSVEFCTTTEALVSGFMELCRSLGQKPVCAHGEAKIYGRVIGPKWRITFRPTFNPFQLSRKAAVWQPPAGQGMRSQHRMIVSAEEIPPKPMRCITVDSPNSMYLVGEGMIPTHNTRGSTEWVRDMDKHWSRLPERHGMGSDHLLRGALLSRTAADVRDTLINGPSGLLHIYPPTEQDLIQWIPSRRLLILPNGSEWLTMSAEEPDQLRGPAFHVALADELAAYKGTVGADGLSAWDNLRIATRLGRTPQIVAATTPKRVPLMRKLVADSQDPAKRILLRKMRTMDNPYLSDAYMEVLNNLYGGTTLGAQELNGDMLDDVEGSMVQTATIDKYRELTPPDDWRSPRWLRVLAVDPSVADKPKDECGIVLVTALRDEKAHMRHAWVLEDYSLHGSPAAWAKVVVEQANANDAVVVVEANQGGGMAKLLIEQTAREMSVQVPKIRSVWATSGKKARSEPIGAAYERGRVHHVGVFADLETQISEWTEDSGYSPDRMDALVWGCSSLLYPATLKQGLPGMGGVGSAARRTSRQVPTRQVTMQRSGGFGRR